MLTVEQRIVEMIIMALRKFPPNVGCCNYLSSSKDLRYLEVKMILVLFFYMEILRVAVR